MLLLGQMFLSQTGSSSDSPRVLPPDDAHGATAALATIEQEPQPSNAGFVTFQPAHHQLVGDGIGGRQSGEVDQREHRDRRQVQTPAGAAQGTLSHPPGTDPLIDLAPMRVEVERARDIE